MTIAGIILAAGESRRLGQPKQLVIWEGETLLRRTVRLASEAGLQPVRVVLGAQAERCREALTGLDAQVILNPRWAEGMGSSLRAGVEGLATDVKAALLLVCDQPALEGAHLQRMLEAHRAEPDRAIASRYAGILGIPALLPRRLFPALSSLGGDAGARVLLRNPDTVGVEFPGGEFDLDGPEDLQRLGR